MHHLNHSCLTFQQHETFLGADSNRMHARPTPPPPSAQPTGEQRKCLPRRKEREREREIRTEVIRVSQIALVVFSTQQTLLFTLCFVYKCVCLSQLKFVLYDAHMPAKHCRELCIEKNTLHGEYSYPQFSYLCNFKTDKKINMVPTTK